MLIDCTCANCGAHFQKFPSQVRPFCSRACYLGTVRHFDIARFESKVDRSGDCHLWTAGTFAAGYGKFRLAGRLQLAHRVAYELAHGPGSADGMFVCHACDIRWPDLTYRRCVNPDHLWLGTSADNQADMTAKGRGRIGELNGAHLHPESRPRGEGHSNAKLTEADVREIRASVLSDCELGERHGVTRQAIHAVRLRRTWRHVP